MPAELFDPTKKKSRNRKALPQYSMWENCKYVIPLRRQVNCLDEYRRKVVCEVPPDYPIPHCFVA